MRKLIVICAVLALTAVSVSAESVNLTGEYWFGSLSVNVNTNVPWAKRGTVTVSGNNWTQQWDDQNGHHTFSSTFTTTTQSDGSVNVNLSSGAYNVAWNGNVMIHADTVHDVDNRLGIDIIMRKVTNVQIGDVVGDYTFFGHQLNSVERDDSAEWGSISLKANGTAPYKFVNDQGSTESGTMNWALDDTNAMITVQGQPSQAGMLLGKTGMNLAFQVLPGEGRDNDLGYNVFIKKTTQTITTADMAGTYQFRFLESGPSGVPYTCGQGTVIFSADGRISTDAYFSDGEHIVNSPSFKVGPGNQITLIGSNGKASPGIISPDKNLIFAREQAYSNPREDTDWIGGLFLVREPSRPDLQFGNISGKTNVKLTVSDPCGVPVTFILTGGGYGEIVREGGVDFRQINLYDTTEKSLLTISTPKGKTTNISKITASGSLKAITAKTTTLIGDINIPGTLGTLALDDVYNATIKIGSPAIPNPKAAVTMTFDILNHVEINSDMPIKSITAALFSGGSLKAPSVGSITTKGGKTTNGDLVADVNVDGAIGAVKVAERLTGSWNSKSVKSIATTLAYDFSLILTQKPDQKITALGSLTTKEYFEGSQIISSGNIGTITAGGFWDSVCFAGVSPAYLVNSNDDVLDLPPAADPAFNEVATIKSVVVKGIGLFKPPYFANSNIAAMNITSASIAYPAYDNGGLPFGITADSIKSLKIKSDNWSYSGTLNIPGNVPSDVPGDFKINIK